MKEGRYMEEGEGRKGDEGRKEHHLSGVKNAHPAKIHLKERRKEGRKES